MTEELKLFTILYICVFNDHNGVRAINLIKCHKLTVFFLLKLTNNFLHKVQTVFLKLKNQKINNPACTSINTSNIFTFNIFHKQFFFVASFRQLTVRQ